MATKRVLLIEDDRDYERLIHTVLAACGGEFEITSEPTLAAGLKALERFPPQLVLVDLMLPDSSGYETFLRLQERAPGVPIIVLTSLDDDHLAIHAVEDGAQDYLVKSLIQPRLIARSVNMALSRQKREAASDPDVFTGPGAVLSLLGTKGGVGTSTTALNVAAVLAQNNYETIVIELQQGRPGTLSLYLQSDPPQGGLNALLQRTADSISPHDLQSCLGEPLRGLHLLCPSAALDKWRSIGGAHVCSMIAAARRLAHFTLLDLPSRIDEGVAEALERADMTMLIVDREQSSLHCAATVLEQIKTAGFRNRERRLIAVDRSGLETPPSLEEIEMQLKMRPLASIPSARTTVALSHAARVPAVVLYPEEPYGLAHFELTERLLSAVAGPHRSSRLNRMLTRTTSWNTIPETTYS